MSNRYSDFEELRPIGEVSHIPDAKLNDGCDGDPGGNASRRAWGLAQRTDGYRRRVPVLWCISPRRADEISVLSHQPSRK